MTNENSETGYNTLSEAIQFAFEQMVKTMWISIPGLIQSYNPSTKRCTVRPALNTVFTDGTTSQPSAIANVPVLWPGGGGFIFLSPLPSGSPVEIKFSQRGLEKFKQTFGNTDPGIGIFDKSDAHVIPGYGALSVNPATTSGASMQDDAGENYIYVDDGNIKIKAVSSIIIESPDNTIDGPLVITDSLTVENGITASGDLEMSGGVITGSNVFSGKSSVEHIHSGVTPGTGNTGGTV